MNKMERFLGDFEADAAPHQVRYAGNQSWTEENLLVESDHNDILYYTTRWDALCPYINVTDEMLQSVPKPFIVYALPPDSDFGVPINDRYGLVDTASADFWNDERRARKFRLYDRQFRDFTCTEEVVPGAHLSCSDIYEMGGAHFENCYIDPREVEGFVGEDKAALHVWIFHARVDELRDGLRQMLARFFLGLLRRQHAVRLRTKREKGAE